MRVPIVPLILLFLMGCSKNAMPPEVSQAKALGYDCILNNSEEYYLCKLLTQQKNNPPTTQFIVLNAIGDTLYQRDLGHGYVNWINNTNIEIYQTPGTMSTELTKDDITIVMNIMTGEVMSKTEFLKDSMVE